MLYWKMLGLLGFSALAGGLFMTGVCISKPGLDIGMLLGVLGVLMLLVAIEFFIALDVWLDPIRNYGKASRREYAHVVLQNDSGAENAVEEAREALLAYLDREIGSGRMARKLKSAL